MEDNLTYDNFRSELNSEFDVMHESGPVQLQLTELSDRKASEKHEEFSIVFRGPLDRPLAQQTYQFSHARLGEFELFIVPVRRMNDGFYYEAVFNRFLEESAYASEG